MPMLCKYEGEAPNSSMDWKTKAPDTGHTIGFLAVWLSMLIAELNAASDSSERGGLYKLQVVAETSVSHGAP